MIEKLTPMQKEAIRAFAKKAKEKGWKYGDEAREGYPAGTICLVMLDPSGYKHWLHVASTGELFFANVGF